MKIQTKFNPGEKVYIMHMNKIFQSEVYSINIQVFDKEDIRVEYDLLGFTKKVIISEEYLFKSKEELINSL